ncbi:hypothetical protein [Bacteroides sp. 519]|uniref:hypothetical protein n=1 Tax=Bacteroides sp. 519 TaxID=2302937 RepID=UPI0013D88770|nr:hypothetical protein [Bacteroides sp. 519]NDV60609.1 hypothetical protein [Bacteroides sp. 519]
MKPNSIKLSIVNCQLSIIIALLLLLFTACAGEAPDPASHAETAPVQITATAQQLLPSSRGGAGLPAEGSTRAPGDIKTKFVPGDKISLQTDEAEPIGSTATLQPDGTWTTDFELPLDGSMPGIRAAHLHYTSQNIEVLFSTTASINNGTLTLGTGPDGTPCWNITLNFRQNNPVVDIVVFNPELNNITARMQQATITNRSGKETIITSPTDVVIPNQGGCTITDITVRVDNIDYTVTGLNNVLNPSTRYTLAFFCNPVASTATLTETGLTWEDGETIGINGYDYVISNAKELKDFMNDSKEIGMGRKAIQIKDIDWPEGKTWMPVGNDASPFTGVYNGNGYIINGLKIGCNTDNANIGMFGYIEDAVLVGIHLRQATTIGNAINSSGLLVGYSSGSTISLCSMQGTIMSNNIMIGGLVGRALNTYITRCYANVVITATFDNGQIGGLVGSSSFSSIIACGANANINATAATTNECRVGGLVGSNTNTSTIYFNYATGSVVIGGNNSEKYCIGGLVGYSSGTIAYNYATADATFTGTSNNLYAGSLLGWKGNAGTITSCHATGKANSIAVGEIGYKTVGNDNGSSNVSSGDDRQATIASATPVTSPAVRTILRKADGTGYDITPQERTFSSDQVWNWTDRITPDINYGYEGEQ